MAMAGPPVLMLITEKHTAELQRQREGDSRLSHHQDLNKSTFGPRNSVKFQTGYEAKRLFFCVPFKIKAFAESGSFWEMTGMTNDALLSLHTRSCNSRSHTHGLNITAFDSSASRQQPESGNKPRPQRPRRTSFHTCRGPRTSFPPPGSRVSADGQRGPELLTCG